MTSKNNIKTDVVVPIEFEEIRGLALTNCGYWNADIEGGIRNWKLKQKFRAEISWHIPTQSLLQILVKYSPIVSIGSGYAYTESEAIKIGADIIATDINPNKKNKWCKRGKFFMEVEELNAFQSVRKYADRNVFLAWPPYSENMASQVAKNMKTGKYLVYIGEGVGGCTGDDGFFNCLEKDFKEINMKAKIYSFWGLHDFLRIFKKIN